MTPLGGVLYSVINITPQILSSLKMSDGVQLDGRVEQHAERIAESPVEFTVITTAGSINKHKPGFATGNLQTNLCTPPPGVLPSGRETHFPILIVIKVNYVATANSTQSKWRLQTKRLTVAVAVSQRGPLSGALYINYIVFGDASHPNLNFVPLIFLYDSIRGSNTLGN